MTTSVYRPVRISENSDQVFADRPRVRIASRGDSVDREKVIDKIGGSIYEGILVAARLTREITLERRRGEIDPFVTGVDGLLALQNNDIDLDKYIKRPSQDWLKSYYNSIKINDSWSE